jgi:hypothetical protein
MKANLFLPQNPQKPRKENLKTPSDMPFKRGLSGSAVGSVAKGLVVNPPSPTFHGHQRCAWQPTYPVTHGFWAKSN